MVNAYSFARIYSSTYVSSDRAIVAGNRIPAAIPTPQKIVPQNLKTHLAMDLNCGLNKKMSGLKVSGQWAQLKGRMCSSDKLKLVEITNLNNGFTASVFSIGVKNYQTDLIQLDEGANKIRVRITPVKGSVEEQTVIINSLPI